MAAIVCFQELFRACILYRVLASIMLPKSSSEIVCEACVCCPPMQLHEQQGRDSGLVVSLETIIALEYRVQDPNKASQYSCCVKGHNSCASSEAKVLQAIADCIGQSLG